MYQVALSISMRTSELCRSNKGNNVVWITPRTFLHYWSRSGFDFSKTVTRVQNLSILENLKFKYLGKWDLGKILLVKWDWGNYSAGSLEVRSNVNGLKEELGHASTNFNYTYKKKTERERERERKIENLFGLWIYDGIKKQVIIRKVFNPKKLIIRKVSCWIEKKKSV